MGGSEDMRGQRKDPLPEHLLSVVDFTFFLFIKAPWAHCPGTGGTGTSFGDLAPEFKLILPGIYSMTLVITLIFQDPVSSGKTGIISDLLI